MIYPPRAFYRPGETVQIHVPEPFQATIWYLDKCVADITGTGQLVWHPPALPRRGYRVRIITKQKEHWTAFDVLDRWTDAPRYGYLFDFKPERTDFNLDTLLAHHINGLQFYDWQYRHDELLPPATVFTDPLGRRLSLDTVRALIDAAHNHSMAAMPYCAIYAASPEFAVDHAAWGLYDIDGELYDFADGFLKLMNPASPWRDHFVSECHDVLDALPFDGVHIDQYGEPKTGFNAGGQPVDLPAEIAATLRSVHGGIPDEKAMLFNLVHNWPLDTIAQTPVDFLYCELWPPQTTLGDLAEVAMKNYLASGGRVPVIAAYINPAYEHTVKLAQSVILASGGYHIAHGEDGLYLSDPYFPKAKHPSSTLAAHLQRLADFGVAYGDLLSFADPIDIDVAVNSDLWPILHRNANRVALSLINAGPEDGWDANLAPRPAHRNVAVSMSATQPIQSVWWVTPDREFPPQQLDADHDGDTLHFNVPYVETWSLICIEHRESER